MMTTIEVLGSRASQATNALAGPRRDPESAPTDEARSIRYSIVDCALGRLLVGATARGVCAVSLGDDDSELIRALQGDYPTAIVRRDDGALTAWVEPIV